MDENIDKERIFAVINSSARRLPGTESTSNFTFSFNEPITRIEQITVTSIQVPNTFYIFNSMNNVLTFNNNTTIATITPGSYNMTNLAFELKNRIDAAFADNTTTVVYAISTYKITITRGTSFIIDASVDVPDSKASKALGFTTSSSNALSATSNRSVNISGPNYILITSNFLTKAKQHKTLYANNNYRDVFLNLPVNVSFGETINLIGKTPVTIINNYKSSIRTTDIIDIKVTDEEKNIIDLNGADISISLVFTTR